MLRPTEQIPPRLTERSSASDFGRNDKRGKDSEREGVSRSLAIFESQDPASGRRPVFPAVDGVTASVTHFVALEVGHVIDTIARFCSFAAVWPGAVIAVLRMVTVIYMSAEAFPAMKPRAPPMKAPAANHSEP
jgi:hypothetical protein